MLRFALFLMIAIVCAPGAAGADAARRYFTPARIQIMRDNLAKYEWARTQRDEVIATAEKWAAYDDEKLCSTLILPPQVPRAYDVNNVGCPVHGTKIYDKGLYSWKWSLDKPFKVMCPIGGEEYPSNDFAAYLATGMKDRSLLTGDCVDDGWGYHRPQDDKTRGNYWFVAYYAHWLMRTYMEEAMKSLTTAAVLTEDPAKARLYAHKCAVMLWKLAQYYPDYDYVSQSREGRDMNPNYHGKIYNRIWEALETPADSAAAYDAVRPFLAGDTELQAFAGKSAGAIEQDIRDRLLMECARCITNNQNRITGNYGMHQQALLKLALILDEKKEHPTSDEMMKFVLDNPAPGKTTDMGLNDALVNLVYRDGMPAECPNYNVNWMQQIIGMAGTLTDCGVDLFKQARVRRLLECPFDIYVSGRFTPSVGDTTNIFARGGQWDTSVCREGLRHLQDDRLAWLVKMEPGSGGDLFKPAIDDLLAQYADKPAPKVGHDSSCLRSYGLANLQTGGETNPIASTMIFSASPGHAHADQLNILLYGYDNVLLPDVGYGEQADHFNWRKAGYFNNTIAHNTVVVDGKMQWRNPTVLHGFSPNGFAQVIDASAEGAYPGVTSLYRRANILVQADPQHAYLFDAFYVRGGKQHDYTVHGTQADFTCEPALGPVQKEGTLAGADVPYEQFYDDPGLKDKPLGTVRYTGYGGSGFQFLTNVQRTPMTGSATGDWKLTEPLKGQPNREWKDIGVRAHYIGMDEELIACDGPLQRYEFLPKSVKCVIRRRTGDNLESRFVSVFEPYKGKTWIKRVSAVTVSPDDGDACAAKVELADGTTHYVFHSLMPERTYILDGRVSVSGQAACLVLNPQHRAVKSMLLNGTQLRYGDYVVRAKGLRRTRIKSVDYSKGVVEIEDPILDSELPVNLPVLVNGGGFSDSLGMQKVIDKTHFSIGDEDLRVAGGPVTELLPNEIVTTVRTPNAVPGMTVLNSLMQPKGRLEKRGESGWFVKSLEPLKAMDFPQAEGDSGPRYYAVVAGPGDEVVFGDCVVRD